jgi:hypothetical protein
MFMQVATNVGREDSDCIYLLTTTLESCSLLEITNLIFLIAN